MKVMWRSVLNTWRIKTRRQGSIPKEVFPPLLRDLWQQMEINSPSNLCSGFWETGLCPLDPQQVLKNLPGSTTKLREGTKERDADVIGRDFDDSSIQLLKENHGQKDQPKQKCGKKVEPGAQITMESLSSKDECSVVALGTGAGSSGLQADRSSNMDKDENHCVVCSTGYESYSGPEWLQCVYCLWWVCGRCNGGVYNRSFACPDCD
ncbi:hypothetical protein HOLleu_32307 [Holothuria leucospilota]|uniref:Uncharacterized protein n=1 Tax=Holothuria leucospilota TaxID=206669 RepID=A0A9Q0YT07_HOLLE|nr:hypothetical protein HOLleu_32307 [Holothuria leucospilota]